MVGHARRKKVHAKSIQHEADPERNNSTGNRKRSSGIKFSGRERRRELAGNLGNALSQVRRYFLEWQSIPGIKRYEQIGRFGTTTRRTRHADVEALVSTCRLSP